MKRFIFTVVLLTVVCTRWSDEVMGSSLRNKGGPTLGKPGCRKPKPGMFGICVEECSGDNDCPAGYLCCSNGCGHTCQPGPTLRQPKCPKLKPGTVGACVEECSEDNDCADGYLCCSNGCGHTCQPGQSENNTTVRDN